jgi:hypothetical protein
MKNGGPCCDNRDARDRRGRVSRLSRLSQGKSACWKNMGTLLFALEKQDERTFLTVSMPNFLIKKQAMETLKT